MGDFPRDIVGKNIKSVRLFLNLSLSNFSTLCDIAKTSLVNIERGNTNYSTDLLDQVLNFIDYNWSEILSIDFKIDPNLREQLIVKHNIVNPDAVLKKMPVIRKAIEQLIQSDVIDTPQYRHVIMEFFQDNGWDFLPNSVTVGLSRSTDIINIFKNKNDPKGHKYSKK